MSKDELVQENDRMTAEVNRLKVGLEEVTLMFQNLEKAFVESKASFSLSRYGELKDMIKKVTSDETMTKVGTSDDSSKRRVIALRPAVVLNICCCSEVLLLF